MYQLSDLSQFNRCAYLKNINLKLIASNFDCCRLASGSWFDVSGEGNVISLFGQDPKEIAKIDTECFFCTLGPGPLAN
jgi:hypothetical protein